MKLSCVIVATLATSLLVEGIFADQRSSGKKLRRVRQGTLREYLPPTNTQKPRPFETAKPPGADGIDINGNFIQGGYPPAGSITPQPPFPIFTGGGVTGEGYPTPTLGYPPPTFPGQTPTGLPGFPTGYPTVHTGNTGPGGYPTPSFPTRVPDTPTPGFPTHVPETPTPGFPTHVPETPTPGHPTHAPETATPGHPTHVPETPTPGFPTHAPETPTPGLPTHAPETPSPDASPAPETPAPGGTTSYPTPGGTTGYPSSQPTPGDFTGYSDGHPTPGVTPEVFTHPPAGTDSPSFPTHLPPGISTGYPDGKPDLSTQSPAEVTTVQPGLPTQSPPGISTESPTQTEATEVSGTSERPAPPTEPSVVETESSTSGPSSNAPVTEVFTSATTQDGQAPPETPTTQSAEVNTIPTEGPTKPGDTQPVETEDDDLKHPPHIHAIDVECARDMMTINIEFNREFNGIIYSKGYYNMPECRYVSENSGQTKYTFTVNLNMCGTEFINAFDTQGQSYLENVLVLQNEARIQEIWDTVRAVRCLWEGNLKESLSVALSVGMLSQELVTFSGDTAIAKLDILLGRGATGEPANGLVKIGEPMTLVVSVSGDPGFDIQVKDCRATDSTGDNTIALTDDNGCVLKQKLFGAFQKTRNTGDTGASIIAYAFFNAFKFPDVMDLMIECNIELCKTDCDMCTDPDQKLEPGRRRRRDLYSYNNTLHDGVTMGKHLRIILPEDLNDKTIVDLRNNEGVCMSTQSFVFSTSLLISILTASCLFSAYMWLKTQHLKLIKK